MRLVTKVPAGRLVIDRAEGQDGAELHELFVRVLAEERWFIASPDELLIDDETMGAQISWLNRQENSVFLIGRIKGVLVGAVKITGGDLRRIRHVGRLEIFVNTNIRQSGVGTAMMQAAIQWAEENPRLSKLSLCVFDDNPRAVHLYERMGFVVEGRRGGEYRERDGSLRGDVLMSRAV